MLQEDFVRVLQTWGAKWCCVDSIFSKTGQAEIRIFVKIHPDVKVLSIRQACLWLW